MSNTEQIPLIYTWNVFRLPCSVSEMHKNATHETCMDLIWSNYTHVSFPDSQYVYTLSRSRAVCTKENLIEQGPIGDVIQEIRNSGAKSVSVAKVIRILEGLETEYETEGKDK